MESVSNSTDRNDDGGSRLSTVFQKTVCLDGWWLIKAEADSSGKRLAVGGLTSREKEPVRTFSSAPIVKRYDVFTLETADGICVALKGFVNKTLTSGNGFPEEVFKHFVFGFPPNWEHYAVNCFESEFSTTAVSENIADPIKLTSPLIRRAVGTPSDSCTLLRRKPQCSKEDTDQHLGCKSDRIISSNLIVEKPFTPTSVHRHHMSVKCESSEKSDANLRRYQDDIVTQGDEEFKNSRKVPISPGGPVNTKHESDTEIPASLKKTKKKLHFNPPESPGTQQMKVQKCIISPKRLSYRRSRSGRLLVPPSESWRNQLPVLDALLDGCQNSRKVPISPGGPVNTKHESDTEIPASLKKTKKKLHFNTPETPGTQQMKVQKCIISPERLSYGRSRSGRVLMPTLEFWRNQLPVYDADRRLTGIQEGLSPSGSCTGSQSEPHMKPRRQAMVGRTNR